MRKSNRLELGLSSVIVAIAAAVSVAGLMIPGLYRDPAVLLPQLYGQDLVTLVLGVPLLVVGMIGLARQSIAGRMLWLGALGYLLYAYATYAFGLVWNPLFLAYTALLGLTLYAFILGIRATPPETAAHRLRGRMPRRTVAWFLMGAAALFAALWLAEELIAAVTGTLPRSVVEMEIPTNFIHVMDLAVVLPALGLAGWLLLRDRPWGYLLSAVLLAKAFTLGAAILAMGWFSARRGYPTDPVLVIAFIGVTGFAGGLLARSLTGSPAPPPT